MRRLGLLAWAACLSAASGAWAVTETPATSAGRLLSDSLGARPSGLAEAGTALVGDLNALSFNPAGLTFMRRSEALARFQTSAGDVNSSVLAVGGRRGRAAWGAGAAFMDAGKIDLAFSDGRRFTKRAQQDMAGQLSAAVSLTDTLSVGAGARFIRSTLVGQYHASAFAGDAGVVFQPPVRGWRLAASARNMGGSLSYVHEGDPLPGEVRVGTSYSYAPAGRSPEEPAEQEEWYTRETLQSPIFTAYLDGVRSRDGSAGAAAALEWTQWPKAAFRAGYGWGADGSGLTLGFGLNLIRYSLDYSWRMVESFSGAHRLSFSIYWD